MKGIMKEGRKSVEVGEGDKSVRVKIRSKRAIQRKYSLFYGEGNRSSPRVLKKTPTWEND